MTSEIPRSQKVQQDFRQWQSGRLLALYAEIKPWTELVLGEYMPVSTQGDWRGMSLLFPMEKLFEHFVALSFAPWTYLNMRLKHSMRQSISVSIRQSKIFKLKA